MRSVARTRNYCGSYFSPPSNILVKKSTSYSMYMVIKRNLQNRKTPLNGHTINTLPYLVQRLFSVAFIQCSVFLGQRFYRYTFETWLLISLLTIILKAKARRHEISLNKIFYMRGKRLCLNQIQSVAIHYLFGSSKSRSIDLHIH